MYLFADEDQHKQLEIWPLEHSVVLECRRRWGREMPHLRGCVTSVTWRQIKCHICCPDNKLERGLSATYTLEQCWNLFLSALMNKSVSKKLFSCLPLVCVFLYIYIWRCPFLGQIWEETSIWGPKNISFKKSGKTCLFDKVYTSIKMNNIKQQNLSLFQRDGKFRRVPLMGRSLAHSICF